MDMRITRRNVGLNLAAFADPVRQPSATVVNLPLRTKNEIDRHCICLVCNEYLDKLTTAHAIGHGYKDKYEMVADGKVRFIEDWRGNNG